jgi:Protein of unknown function (DUF2877)
VAALPAHLVAAPVLERAGGGRGGVVLGAGATAAWVDLDGFVVAVTTREVPLLPNAVALAAGAGALAGPDVAAGAAARLSPGRVDLGGLRVTWDPAAPPVWDPAVPVLAGATPEAVAGRGAALLHALGVGPGDLVGGLAKVGPGDLVGELARVGLATAADPEGAAGLALLLRAVRERDPDPAAAASRVLAGRGPGLTPEGDDLLAAVAGAVAVLGPASGFDGPGRERFLAALAPEPGRTTALSATLLALAAEGRMAEPAGRLLDLSPAGETAWPGALSRLERLGHGSGRAYAAGIAATATLLAEGTSVR